MWKSKAVDQRGLCKVISHHKMDSTLSSSLASTFLAPPADSKPPQEAKLSSWHEEAAQWVHASSMKDTPTWQKDLLRIFLLCKGLESQAS